MSLKVTIVQTELHWENPPANLEMLTKKMNEMQDTTDLIVLPEMFTTGFSMNPTHLAEPPLGNTHQWMVDLAARKNAAITGSYIIEENANHYNRLLFVLPDGTYYKYDKRHTFTFAKENLAYSRGTDHLIVEYKGWKIFPLICYDLRFPVWARNTFNYDLLIYIANWPKTRTLAWDTLLRARAIENMAYCVGVNRVGIDGENLEYVGHSAIYDVLGEQVSKSGFGEFIETVNLEKEDIENNRKRFQFLKDMDSFSIQK